MKNMIFLMMSHMLLSSTIMIMISFLMKMKKIEIFMEWMIFNINSCQIEFIIYLDWMFMIFTSFILFISSMIILYSSNYMKNDSHFKKFLWLIYMFIISMIFMISSPSPMSIILGWDFLGFISFCLILFFQNYKSYNSSMTTILTNRIGDITLIMTIILMTDMGSWNLMFNEKQWKMMWMISILLISSSMTKSAQIPFSSWLPQAMAAPTPISALVHSSTLVTAGIYLMMRFNKILFNKIPMMLLIFSLLTMMMSGLMANLENDLKKIIALSTLSQMALMMSSLSMKLTQTTFFHLLTHAMFKSLMFMCAGIMIHSMNENQDIRNMMKLNMQIPIITLIFSISALSLSGMFFMSGFYSKDLIIDLISMNKFNFMISTIFIFSASLTFSYTIRLIYFINFNFNNFKSINYCFNNWTINYSMFFSFLFSICLGSILMNTIFNKEKIIILPCKIKLIMMILLILNMLFFIYIKKINNNKYNFMFYNIKFFFNKMWFLDNMIKNYLFLIKIFNIIDYNLDKKWIEFYSLNSIKFLIFMIKIKKLMIIKTIYLMLLMILITYFIL